jgi:hypothetical protein
MVNILGHKGNTNQNCIEILSHSSHNDHHQDNKQQQMLARIQEKEILCTVGGDVN